MKKILSSAFALSLLASSLHAATVRLSESSTNVQADGSNLSVKLSDDGRFAVFTTNSTNLFANDVNTFSDVVLKDTQTGALTCMSCNGALQADAAASLPAISGDGRFVSFQSAATNLVAGDTNAAVDVFVREIATGTLTIVSRADTATGVLGSATSGQSRLSTDGRYVSFGSTATNLVAGDTNGIADIFVRDRQLNTTARVSVATGGVQATSTVGGSTEAALSGDGRYLVVRSGATTLTAPVDTNALIDCFLVDRGVAPFAAANIVTTRLTTTAGTTGNCGGPAISRDGSMLGFNSSFADLVAGDTNASTDAFFVARVGGTLTRVTGMAGAQATGFTDAPSFNATGTRVAVSSDSTNFVANDTNVVGDIFVYTISSQTHERVNVDSAGVQTTSGNSTFPWLAASSSAVAFNSASTNLVANDTNATVDTFLNTGANATLTISVASGGNLSLSAPVGTALGTGITFTNTVTGTTGTVVCQVNAPANGWSVSPTTAQNVVFGSPVRVNFVLNATSFGSANATATCTGAGLLAGYTINLLGNVTVSQIPALNGLGLLLLVGASLLLAGLFLRR